MMPLVQDQLLDLLTSRIPNYTVLAAFQEQSAHTQTHTLTPPHHTHTQTHPRSHTLTHTQTHPPLHTQTHKHIHTHTQHTLVFIQTYVSDLLKT